MCMILVILCPYNEKETDNNFDFCLCFYLPLDSNDDSNKEEKLSTEQKNESLLFCVGAPFSMRFVCILLPLFRFPLSFV